MIALSRQKNNIITEIRSFVTTGEKLYLFALLLYVFYAMLNTTCFGLKSYLDEGDLWRVVFGVILYKMLFLDEWKYREAIGIVVLVGIVLSVNYFGENRVPFREVMLIIGAKNVDLKKILQLHLAVRIIVVGMAVLCSLTGVIENLQYVRGDEIRNSFGIVYPTDFGAHILFGYLTFLVITHSVRQMWHWLLGVMLAWFIYVYSGARWNAGMLIAGVVFFIFLERDNFKRRELHYFLLLCGSILAVPVIAGVTAANIWVCAQKQSTLDWVKLYFDSYGSRMDISVRMLQRYPVTFLGQYVDMQGFGGDVTRPWKVKDVTFLDISYLNILLRFGILFSIALFVIYTLICLKYKRRRDILLVLMLVALSGFMEHHILEIAYNPFFLLLFAKGDCLDEYKGIRRQYGN